MREDRLRLDGGAREVVHGAGATFTVPPDAIHCVLHAGDGQAVTIPAYTPRLRRQGAYSLDAGGVLPENAQSREEELRADTALVAGPQ